MPVKYWSRAGLVLTYWCNARCPSCYLCCSPDRQEKMTVEEAISYWRGLVDASIHGCRIHLTGGEPFGDWPRLIAIARRAKAESLGPLEKVETNAFWADHPSLVRRRLRELDEAGMIKLVISADPYHQQFVPIERCRLAAKTAEEVLGKSRVQVRWRDWLEGGFDTDRLDERERRRLFARYATGGRDRFNGRAAELLTRELRYRAAEEFADKPCKDRLLRSKHVHVGPAGEIMPGVCAGIVLGWASRESIPQIWRRLASDYPRRTIVGTLAEKGPVGLLPEARDSGFRPQTGYASKCHLCWDIRKHFVRTGLHRDELAPDWMYEQMYEQKTVSA